MNNWDVYQSVLNLLAGTYLLVLFTSCDFELLNILMTLFFGWVVGAGVMVRILEGGK